MNRYDYSPHHHRHDKFIEPSVILFDGTQLWYEDDDFQIKPGRHQGIQVKLGLKVTTYVGSLHRHGGPAVIWGKTGKQEFWLRGVLYEEYTPPNE